QCGLALEAHSGTLHLVHHKLLCGGWSPSNKRVKGSSKFLFTTIRFPFDRA
ncbi:14078_t:CDS:2, partial [Dentiscutata erythropus]